MLEHAQDVVADSVETVIKGLKPTFELIETEGDAQSATRDTLAR